MGDLSDRLHGYLLTASGDSRLPRARLVGVPGIANWPNETFAHAGTNAPTLVLQPRPHTSTLNITLDGSLVMLLSVCCCQARDFCWTFSLDWVDVDGGASRLPAIDPARVSLTVWPSTRSYHENEATLTVSGRNTGNAAGLLQFQATCTPAVPEGLFENVLGRVAPGDRFEVSLQHVAEIG